MKATMTVIAVMFLGLAGCASTYTPPPEPDMTNLVNVNTQIPPELYGTRIGADTGRKEDQ